MKKFFECTLISQDAGGDWEEEEADREKGIPNQSKSLSEVSWVSGQKEGWRASKKLRQRIGESGSKITSLRSFPWGMDSRVEDEGRKLALIAAEPLNPREILTMCANGKSIRPTALLPLNSGKRGQDRKGGPNEEN